MVSPVTDMPLRFMVIHLHPASARLRYLKFGYGELCMPRPLPKLADMPDGHPQPARVAVHPRHGFDRACTRMQLPPERLQIEPDFRLWVDTPAGILPVYLLRVSGPDPFSAPDGARWIELPDCFAMRPLERLLMQAVYTHLLE